MDAVKIVVCVMCERVDLPQASSVYTLTIRVCVCVCARACERTQCTFLFLRNGTRAKPDAPVKESPHGHIRSYYYCHTWYDSQSEGPADASCVSQWQQQ